MLCQHVVFASRTNETNDFNTKIVVFASLTNETYEMIVFT
jgi:hypothetical protein